MRCLKSLLVACAFAVLSIGSGVANAAPEVGWWWNPGQGDRGFFIESREDLIYLAGYLYDTDGRALWLVAGGSNDDPYRYSGRLLAYTGGQTLLGEYRPPAAPTDVGPISLQFSDDTHATLTWPGGSIALQRHYYDHAPTVFESHSGWWWNERESGRGYCLEVQGNTVVFVGFMYDDAGRPVWYYAAGPLSAPTTFTGPLVRFAHGRTMTGEDQAQNSVVTYGMLTIEFGAPDEATLIVSPIVATPKHAAAAALGHPKTIAIKPQFGN